MSQSFLRGPRLHLLAAATAVALSSLAAAPAFAGRVDLAGLQSESEFDQFIVKYHADSAAKKDAAARNKGLQNAAAKAGKAKGRAFGLSHKRGMSMGLDVIRADRKLDRADAEAVMRELAADPSVVYVAIDRLMRTAVEVTPNDPKYNGATDKQWHYFNSTVGINLPNAWNRSTGSGVVVAVVDSGIIAHDDLSANILPGYDMVSSTSTGNAGSGDGDGRDSDPTDSSGIEHGTHVAGTIAAVTNNAKGVAGVAYNAKVVPVRALGNGGYGSSSDIADGIIWAAGGSVPGVPANANPAEVINLSLGGSGSCGTVYQDAINSAVANGAVMVIAAGNSNNNVSGFSPANCANTVTVTASDINGNRAWYSNYGTTIDITAPGGETCSPTAEFLALGESTAGKCVQNHTTKGILSTVKANGYAYYQGTSMAAPHVAGVVALIQAKAATPKTTAEILTILKDTARPIAAANCPGDCGPGIMEADAAVAKVDTTTGAAPVAGFTFTVSELTATFTDASTDSDGTIASRSWDFGDSTAVSTATNPTHTYAVAGTYSVKLTVTDNSGNTNTITKSVTVASSSGNTLTNGVAVTNVSGALGSSQTWTLAVPANSTALKFVTSGGTGDADLYVKFGSAPTTTSYDCKSEGSTNAETCNIATAQTGTYYVLIKGYSAFSGLSLTGSYSAGSSAQTYSNTADYNIPDNNATGISSPITVSGRTGNAPTNASISVNVVHPYVNDLKLDLIAPDGTVYNLRTNTGGSADNIVATYTKDLSSEPLNGTWKLRAIDNAGADVGYINSWSVTF